MMKALQSKFLLRLTLFALLFLENSSVWDPLGVRPDFLFIGLYGCGLQQPEVLSFFLILILGFLKDSYFALPIGQSTLLYWLLFMWEQKQLRLWPNNGLFLDLLMFIALVFLATLYQATILKILAHQEVLWPVLFKEACLTIAFYPLITWLISKITAFNQRLQKKHERNAL